MRRWRPTAWSKAAIDWLVPHQANMRIIQAMAKKLGLPMERVIVTVQEHGNTSTASVPLALDVGVRDGRIKRGDLLLLEALGGGFTWGSALSALLRRCSCGSRCYSAPPENRRAGAQARASIKNAAQSAAFSLQGPIELLRNRLLEHAIDLLVGRIDRRLRSLRGRQRLVGRALRTAGSRGCLTRRTLRSAGGT